MDAIVDVRTVVEAVSSGHDDPRCNIDSMCMRCEKYGTTTLLLTALPNFGLVLVSYFECPHCEERNNKVDFVGQLQPKACQYTLKVSPNNKKLLDMLVVKSDSATIKIPELDFEIRPEARHGSLSTLEGILTRVSDELLLALQDERKNVDPAIAEGIDEFLLKLKACAAGELPFTFILEDLAGNSYIDNPHALSLDPALTIKFYERTPEQQKLLGYSADPSQLGQNSYEATSQNQTYLPHGSVGAIAGLRAIAKENDSETPDAEFWNDEPEEGMAFDSKCYACFTSCKTRMCQTKIPYFQEVIVMVTSCDSCGYHNSELKTCGGIPEKGKKVKVRVENIRDLNRFLIKSDSATVIIPEIELRVSLWTFGGLVTTVEGLIKKISEHLGMIHVSLGDGVEEESKNKWSEFRSRLDKLLSLERPWNLILDDALANSFIEPLCDEDDIKCDTQLSSEEYERTREQNDNLGLNDMDTSSADVAYSSSNNAAAA